MKIKFSLAALRDLMDIGEHISITNRRRAETFTLELEAAAVSIAEMPLAFPLVPRAENVRLRRKRHRRYLIFYVAGEAGVEIIRILHGARDYERVLFPDDEQP
jgi:toxin ParE1/3/4